MRNVAIELKIRIEEMRRGIVSSVPGMPRPDSFYVRHNGKLYRVSYRECKGRAGCWHSQVMKPRR